MDKSQLYNQIAAMLNGKPAGQRVSGAAHVAAVTPQGTKANSKAGMSNHNVRTTNKQNPNKTYPASIIKKTAEKIGGF